MRIARTLDYVVEPDERHWTVRLVGGSRAGLFPTRIAALRSAAGDADRAWRLGYDARILVRAADGSVKRVSPGRQAG